MKSTLSVLVLCLAIAAVGCGGDDDSTDATTAGESASAQSGAEAAGRTKPEVTVPRGAPPRKLVKSDLVEGGGPTAKAGDEVTVQYVGVNFKDGGEFDASWDRGEPFSFTLGGGEVIPGWDRGVVGMKVGGQRQLVVPPDLGYGKTGFPPAIPPDETLVFVVDLLEVN